MARNINLTQTSLWQKGEALAHTTESSASSLHSSPALFCAGSFCRCLGIKINWDDSDHMLTVDCSDWPELGPVLTLVIRLGQLWLVSPLNVLVFVLQFRGCAFIKGSHQIHGSRPQGGAWGFICTPDPLGAREAADPVTRRACLSGHYPKGAWRQEGRQGRTAHPRRNPGLTSMCQTCWAPEKSSWLQRASLLLIPEILPWL